MTREPKQKPVRSATGASWMSLLVGLFSGLVIGLAIAFAVAWYVNRMPNPFAQKANGTTATRPEVANPDAAKVEPLPRADVKPEAKSATRPDPKIAKAEEEKPRFDFYRILPGSEEPLSDRDLKRAEQKTAGTGAKELYFLQAGAFQNAADADNMKARLALMGMEASIQTAAIPDKGMLHRVRVGPFGSVDELNKVRTALKENGVQATPVKVSEGPGR